MSVHIIMSHDTSHETRIRLHIFIDLNVNEHTCNIIYSFSDMHCNMIMREYVQYHLYYITVYDADKEISSLLD